MKRLLTVFHLVLSNYKDKHVNITPIKALMKCTVVNIVYTVNFLNIRTPKIFVVITLKFELCGSTIE